MKGIDVSKHQGKIDWKKVKGVDFAIVRAGYGKYKNQMDPQFEENMRGAKAAGIPAGVYWYSYAVTLEEAREEAKVCLATIQKYRDQIVLPVFFDQEYEPGIKDQSKEVRTQLCREFLRAIQAAGYRPGLYCSYDWYMNWLDREKLLEYPVWIAQYASKCSYTGKNLIAWQYTSRGRVGGINGNVDLDEGYDGLFPGKSGWVQASTAWYWYEDGSPVKNRWVKDGGFRYYLGPTGKMLTGLQAIGGKVYSLNPERKTVGGITFPKGACLITDQSGAVKQ